MSLLADLLVSFDVFRYLKGYIRDSRDNGPLSEEQRLKHFQAMLRKHQDTLQFCTE